MATHARNDDYRTERGIWEDLLAKRPNNGRAHRSAAKCAWDANEPEVAEREYRTAAQLDPTPESFCSWGSFLVSRGRKEEARVAFDEAVKCDQNGVGYSGRAWMHSELGEHDAALADAERVLAQNTTADAYMVRAQVHAKAGRGGAAIADYTRAIELGPTTPAARASAFEKRARLRGAVGDDAGAIADLTEALRLNPDEPNYYVGRADSYQALGKMAEALADMDAALSLNPVPVFFYLRGELFRRQRRYDEAVADLDRAIEGNATSKDASLARGLCHARKRRADSARADLLRYQELGGHIDEPELRNLLTRGQP